MCCDCWGHPYDDVPLYSVNGQYGVWSGHVHGTWSQLGQLGFFARPSLGEKAAYVYGLSGFYLVASVINVLASLTMRTSGQILLLLSTLGVALGGAAFLTWTFDSLKGTMGILLERKQHAKLQMYERLAAILKALYAGTILCLLASVLFIAGSGTSQDWYAGHWQWLWLMTDGWQNLLNLGGVLAISYVFRPRSHNRTYGMNELSGEPLDEDVEGGKIGLDTISSQLDGTATEAHGKVYGRVGSGEATARSGGFDEGPEWARPQNPFDDS